MKSFISHMQLQEIGNQPYRWKQDRFIEDKVWTASFVTDNKQKYHFEALKVADGWEIIFSASQTGNDTGITGTQGASAVRVFSTVAKLLEVFVKEVSPNKFSFAADKSEADGTSVRAKLYSRFAKVFAKKNGYNTKELNKSDEVHFVFTRKKGRK